jgi:Cu+-exporting ATPase
VALRRDRMTANPIAAPAAIAGFATDPVCGMTVDTTDAAPTASHDGETYFFCCSGCREQFVANPARYIRATAG